jgi:hypothetical protein
VRQTRTVERLAETDGQQAAARGESQRLHPAILVRISLMVVPLTEFPQIPPFEPAQVRGAGCWAVFVDQLDGPTQVAGGQRLVRQIHVRHVLIEPGE